MKDVLTKLKNEIYSILIDYQWEFNTLENRNDIKLKVDNICSKNIEGFYSNRVNDINANELVLETFVEVDGQVIFLESLLLNSGIS